MALDFKCSADLKCINAVYEEGQGKKKPPSQCKQAVAQSSETIRTKNVSYLEKKAKRNCPDTTDIHKSSL